MAKAHQRDVRDDQDHQQGQQVCMVLPNVTVLISFFLTEGNKKILIHKEKSRFPFSATAHDRDFENFKKAVFFLNVIFQNETVCNFCLKKNVLLSFREA